MEDCHADKIEQLRDHLIDKTHFSKLWESLVDQGNVSMFSEDMVTDIMSTPHNYEQNERFYDLIVTLPDPHAFKFLVSALSSSGQNDLSLLLLEEKLVNDQVDSRNVRYPHIPPLLTKVKVCRSPSKLSKWADVSRKQTSYFVESSPRGYLLLINMTFKMNPLSNMREGSEVDVTNLKSLFKQLDYKIIEAHNLTLRQMKEVVEKFSRMEELRSVDSVLVFVMSHGRDPSNRKPYDPPLKSPGRESVDIELEDNKYMNSNDIVDLINQSPTIKPNTPKLFFFNVCRGEKIDYGLNHGLETEEDGSVDTSTQVDVQVNYEHYVIADDPAQSSASTPEPSQESHQVSNGNENETLSNGLHNNTIVPSNGKQCKNQGENSNSQQNDLLSSSSAQNDVAIGHNHSNGFSSILSHKTPGTISGGDQALMNGQRVRSNHVSFSEDTRVTNKNLMVQVAIWFAKRCKCSMPTVEEEQSGTQENALVVNSNPAGVKGGEVLEEDSTDTEVAEVTRNVDARRTASNASTHSVEKVRQAVSAGIRDLASMIAHPRRHKHTGDIFMAFSTVDGYNSKRHPNRGSWFITLICQVFADMAKDTDLITMMEEVDRRLRNMFDRRYGTQMYVKKTEGFSKKFFFNVETNNNN